MYHGCAQVSELQCELALCNHHPRQSWVNTNPEDQSSGFGFLVGNRSRLENQRDDGQNDKYDDKPFGDLHAEPGNPLGSEDHRNDRKYQEQDREFEEPASEQERG